MFFGRELREKIQPEIMELIKQQRLNRLCEGTCFRKISSRRRQGEAQHLHMYAHRSKHEFTTLQTWLLVIRIRIHCHASCIHKRSASVSSFVFFCSLFPSPYSLFHVKTPREIFYLRGIFEAVDCCASAVMIAQKFSGSLSLWGRHIVKLCLSPRCIQKSRNTRVCLEVHARRLPSPFASAHTGKGRANKCKGA